MLFTIQLSSLIPSESVSLNLIKSVYRSGQRYCQHHSARFLLLFLTLLSQKLQLSTSYFSEIDFRLSRNASLELKLSQNFNFTRLRCNPTRFDDQKATDRFVDFYDHFTVVLLIFLRRFPTAVLMLRALSHPLVFASPLC